MKIVDLLLVAYFCFSPIFYCSYLTILKCCVLAKQCTGKSEFKWTTLDQIVGETGQGWKNSLEKFEPKCLDKFRQVWANLDILNQFGKVSANLDNYDMIKPIFTCFYKFWHV